MTQVKLQKNLACKVCEFMNNLYNMLFIKN